MEQLYRITDQGTIEEVPLPCPADHEETTPAWGDCTVEGCWEMGRQWRCTRCGQITQHEHEHRGQNNN